MSDYRYSLGKKAQELVRISEIHFSAAVEALGSALVRWYEKSCDPDDLFDETSHPIIILDEEPSSQQLNFIKS